MPQDLIVGLDIGTTKICAVVGEVRDQQLDIVGLGTAPTAGGLRKGVVVNIENTVRAIRRAAVPDLEAKITAARALRRRGYKGLLSATHLYPEESGPIIEAGCDVTYNYYTEAGVGFARHTYETLMQSPAMKAVG